ncbi:MAG: M20 metallopeptidase family protein [Candidatus Kapaibacteriota bacterium]
MKTYDLFHEIDNIFNVVVEIRRTLHSNPELSFKEFRTAENIQNFLSNIGIKSTRIAETGIVATIGKSNDEKCIAFRADIDALPIQEETNLPFASKSPGVMHACGHDMHTSVLLGSAIILKKFEDLLPIQIKLIFQPAEEKLPGGAKILIEHGVLRNPDVIAVFGEHTDPETEVGSIALAPGTIMASADELYWIVRGKSSHAAQPHLGSDPIRAAVALANSLFDLPNRIRDPLEPLHLAITSFNGGFATNIFPDEVKLMGTLRSFKESTRRVALQHIENISKAISAIYGVNVAFEPIIGYPPLRNDYQLCEFVENIGTEILGSGKVKKFAPKMWAEDFAYYSQLVPSVFWFLGVKPKDYTGEMFGLHSSKYNPDEEAMKYGIAMFVKIGFSYKIKQ